MARIVIEEPCPKCGTFSTARTDDPRHLGAFGWCDGPGGSRRVLDPGSYVLIEKVDGEWPAIGVDGHFVVGPLMIQTIAAALAGGEQP